MRNNKKKKSLMLLLLLVLGVTVGYAILTTTLNINGTTKVKNATWNIYWDNPVVQAGSISTTTPTIDTLKTTASFNVVLNNPGDFYEFTIDAKNDGTIDGMISNISYKLNNTEISEENKLPTYLNYTVTYGDDTALEVNHFLKANTKETYKVRVEFKKDIENNELPAEEVDLDLKFAVTYIQADNNGKPVRLSSGSQMLIGKSSPTTSTTEPVAIQHVTTEQVPATTDYRYMGANPNNYILFNCDSDNPNNQNTSNCEVWRIIGLFGDNLKIIRNDSISEMDWDDNKESNSWANSTLKSYLNTEYYNSLKTSAKNKIEESVWYLGDWYDYPGYYDYENELYDEELGNYLYSGTHTDTFPEGAYKGERGTKTYYNNETNLTAKIGLMYPSDYAYASSACYSTCVATSATCRSEAGTYHISFSTYDISENGIDKDYEASECRESNWLRKEENQFTITPYGNENGVHLATSYGSVGTSHSTTYMVNQDEKVSVRPTLYLKADVKIIGAGTQTDPYKISQ